MGTFYWPLWCLQYLGCLLFPCLSFWCGPSTQEKLSPLYGKIRPEEIREVSGVLVGYSVALTLLFFFVITVDVKRRCGIALSKPTPVTYHFWKSRISRLPAVPDKGDISRNCVSCILDTTSLFPSMKCFLPTLKNVALHKFFLEIILHAQNTTSIEIFLEIKILG